MNRPEILLQPPLLWVGYGAAGLFIIGFVAVAVAILPFLFAVPQKKGRTWSERSYYASQHSALFFVDPRHKRQRKLLTLGFGACGISLLTIVVLTYLFGSPGQ